MSMIQVFTRGQSTFRNCVVVLHSSRENSFHGLFCWPASTVCIMACFDGLHAKVCYRLQDNGPFLALILGKRLKPLKAFPFGDPSSKCVEVADGGLGVLHIGKSLGMAARTSGSE